MDSLYLSVNSGYQQYSIAVADNGSTRLAMGRSKGKTTILNIIAESIKAMIITSDDVFEFLQRQRRKFEAFNQQCSRFSDEMSRRRATYRGICISINTLTGPAIKWMNDSMQRSFTRPARNWHRPSGYSWILMMNSIITDQVKTTAES
ncbi:MAG: hypothetical protein PUC61_10585 [Bacteroidales bacterium]|nr:hypothetical protein [Bacteroidales bacterium]